jgi:hypothetical protein
MVKASLLPIIVLLLISACASEKKQDINEQKETKQAPAKAILDTAKYLELGDDLVGETKRKISTTLVDAMEKGGVKYAAQFCNLVAYPIVDSISKVHHARIRRVSDKPRNPKDAMDEEEQKVFAIFKAKAQMPNAELMPIVMQHDDGTVGYYAPIKISMPTCLKCHGEVGKDIKAEDYKVLKSLYPNDVAVGYKEGELRGMFSIRFSKAH